MVEGDPFDPEAEHTEELSRVEKASSASEEAWRTINARREAYARVFAGCGSASDKEAVLKDLAVFCRGGRPVFHENDRVHCLLTGRQEVYMRILDNITLSTDELVERLNEGRT